MSSSALLCPSCRRILGFRRQNGSIRPKTTIEHDDDGWWLVCPVCGGRKRLENMTPLLVPI